MALHKIKDFDSDYRDHFDNTDIIGFELYSGTEKVGSVDDILVDDRGSFRYFVINTGVWILGKKTLLPIGLARIDTTHRRVYADTLSKSQVEGLPEFDGLNSVNYEQEERTRGVYRAATVDTENPLRDAAMASSSTAPTFPPYDADTYDYDRDAALYDLNDPARQNLKLYEERLIANKTRQKTGEVAIGKRVETEAAKVAVPVEKERVVIERTPGDAKAVSVGEADFQAGEVARMEVYEEVPEIRKETYVREEVNIRKEVDRETVTAEEQLRREELDIDKGLEQPATKRAM
ncbi:MAG: hypothetical protein RLZZ135_1480 [Cyanobacteriota bacterium]|jgi:uncharacterized protein (TIGR02271 family)